MALTDDQVQGEMRKMVSFIKQEALEKAKEIHIKADEEFAIEKARLVRQEQSKIDDQYAARLKKAGMSQQIAKSTVINKARLKILAARQEALDDIFEEARKQLTDVSSDSAKYEKLLQQLLLQGYLKLMDKDVTISARKIDIDIVKKAIKPSVAKFKEKSGLDVKVKVDETDLLAEASQGGVIIKAQGGMIRVDNTLEERLKLMRINGLPLVRTSLFGESKTRTFHD